MTIQTQTENNTATLRIIGRVDTTTAPELEAAIAALPAETTALILDMSEVVYISSAGLRVLLGAQKRMSKVGSLKLVGVGEAVMEVLEITGFTDILEIEP